MSAGTDLSIVPANQASCDDLDAIFGLRGYPARCRCQRFRTTGDEWWHNPIPLEERIFRLRQQTDCGYPDSETTSGLVGYLEESRSPGAPSIGAAKTWGEMNVGNRKVFEHAGFRQVSRPSKRRVVMRIDF